MEELCLDGFDLHFIKKGKVKTYRINDDGKELVVKLYNEGEFLGYTALIEKCNYKEFAEALDDCEITSIPISEFEIVMFGTIGSVFGKFGQSSITKDIYKAESCLGNKYGGTYDFATSVKNNTYEYSLNSHYH